MLAMDFMLLLCAEDGDLVEVKKLLDDGADPNVIDYDNGFTPLMYAVNGNHLDCVKALIKAGADPLITDYEGRTSYDIARTKEAREILNVNANRMMPLYVNAYRKSNKTKLPMAVLRE